MRIVLDGMGSDSYPAPEVAGAALAVQEFGMELVLTGDEALLKPLLANLPAEVQQKIQLVHAPEHISMGEKPAFAARQKSNNSMARGLQMVRDAEADAFISMGNTGAALASGLMILRRIAGVKRPALSAPIPTAKGRAVLLDVGANAECKPEYLLQFAIMGSIYAEKVLGIAKPRVGLLSNGEEANKGNELVKASHPLLQESGLNFIGNVEGKEVFGGDVDVIVTDGFTGNVTLKTAEAVAKLIVGKIRGGIMDGNALVKLGGALVKGSLRGAMRDLDPGEVGAAPLLGLNGLVMIGHGRSDARAVRSAIQATRLALSQNMLPAIREQITQRFRVEEAE